LIGNNRPIESALSLSRSCNFVRSAQNITMIGFERAGDSLCTGMSSVEYPTLAALESFMVTKSNTAVGGSVFLPATSLSLVTGFDAATASTVMMTTGFPLATTGSCTLVRGGRDVLALVPKDVTGKARTLPLSIGAWEEDTCQ